MTTHHVYVHDRHGTEAIKDGFSWPGFLLTWIWAFDKHLWRTGAGLLVVQLGLVGAVYVGQAAEAPLWTIAAVLADLVCRALVGQFGNYWRENSMDPRGFVFEGSTQAATPAEARGRVLGVGQISDSTGSGMARFRAPAAILATVLLVAIVSALWPDREAPAPTSRRPDAEPAIAEPAARPEAAYPEQATPAPSIEPPRSLDRSLARPTPAVVPTSPASPSRPAAAAVRPTAPATSVAVNPPPRSAPTGTPAPPSSAAPAGAVGQAPAVNRSLAAKEEAWLRYFRPSANCTNPPDWDAYVECANQQMRARAAFDQKWAAGQLN